MESLLGYDIVNGILRVFHLSDFSPLFLNMVLLTSMPNIKNFVILFSKNNPPNIFFLGQRAIKM